MWLGPSPRIITNGIRANLEPLNEGLNHFTYSPSKNFPLFLIHIS